MGRGGGSGKMELVFLQTPIPKELSFDLMVLEEHTPKAVFIPLSQNSSTSNSLFPGGPWLLTIRGNCGIYWPPEAVDNRTNNRLIRKLYKESWGIRSPQGALTSSARFLGLWKATCLRKDVHKPGLWECRPEEILSSHLWWTEVLHN